jgi:hypothetical protein
MAPAAEQTSPQGDASNADSDSVNVLSLYEYSKKPNDLYDAKCTFCGKSWQSVRPRKLKAHLAGVSNLGIAACSKVPKSVRDQFRSETEASKTRRSSIGQRSILACYDPSVQHAKDSAVADLIISHRLPFEICNSPEFLRLCEVLSPKNQPYVPPGPWKVANAMLEQKYGVTKREVRLCYQYKRVGRRTE